MALMSRQIVSAICLVLCTASTTQAAPIFYSNVYVGVVDARDPFNPDVESVLVYGVDSLGPLTAVLPGASAIGSVLDADLRAYATIDGRGTSALAFVSFFDTLTLESLSLPDGTAVQLRAEVLFSREVTPNGIPAGAPCSSAAVSYAGMDAGGSGSGSLYVQDSTCDIFDINNPTGFFSGVIGQELTINAFLNAGVGAFSPATADASNTLRFLLTPIGDFTYSAASGNSYLREAAPVPEPSILFLLGTAAATLAGRVRQRVMKTQRD